LAQLKACAEAEVRVPSGPLSTQRAKIYINGRFLQQPITGVQRYSRELVKAWDGLLASGWIDPVLFEFVILVPRGAVSSPVPLQHIEVRPVGRLRGHAWAQVEFPLHARDGVMFSPGNIHPAITLRRPGVVTVHAVVHLYFASSYSIGIRNLYSLLLPRSMASAQAVITVSESERRNIIRMYPWVRDRIFVVHPGVNHFEHLPHPTPSEASNPEDYVLWVSSLIKLKNLQNVIDAIDLLNEQMPLRLIVVGGSDGGLLSCDLRIPSRIGGRVEFRGQVNDSDVLSDLYQHALCFAFTSLYESFGLGPLEAMRHGCPVVVSNIPALRETCADAALFCDPRNPADLARQITLLANDRRLRNELRNRGLERSSSFTWEACAKKTFQILQGMFPAGTSPPRSQQGHNPV
jgi:glycosyltransferase involved in cell wall biosynthesis